MKPHLPLIFRILSTINICLATVATPLLVRVLIDGVIPSKDMIAIVVTLLILGFSELINIVLQFYLSLHLDSLESSELARKKEELLKNIYNCFKFTVDQNKFLDFWNNDLQRSVYLKIKNPWYRIKDGLMILLLSIICLNISYLAGGVVLFIFGLNLALVYFSQQKQTRIFTKSMSARDQEREILIHTMTNLEDLQDHNQWSKLEQETLNQLGEVKNLKEQQSYQRSTDQRQGGLIKLALIFGILAVGGILFAQDKFSMGNLWALMITIYRINGPIQSYCRWILNVRSEAMLQLRVDQMWQSISQQEYTKPEYFNRLSKILDEVVNKNKHIYIEQDKMVDLSSIKEAIRFWKSRSGKKDDIFILMDDEIAISGKINIRFTRSGYNKNDNLVFGYSISGQTNFDSYYKITQNFDKLEFTQYNPNS